MSRVAFVACSYDTDHEPLQAQVLGKIEELNQAYGLDGEVEWSLWIVDDLPAERGFSARVRAAYADHPDLSRSGRLQVVRLTETDPVPGGLKGAALRDGFRAALRAAPDALVYINLNLKVSPGLAAAGLRLLAGCDAAIGTRSPREGGRTEGAGVAGTFKSRAFNALTRALLPPLRGYRDTNAPLKVFSPRAAEVIVRLAEVPSVTMDCEWLMILARTGLKIRRYPITWRQRPGSRPPWHLAPQSLADLVRIRRRWVSVEE